MAEPGVIGKAKSYRDIEAQRRRIEDRMREAYYDAERIESNSERRAELARLNSRMMRVNNMATIYQNNIREQPNYQQALRAWGQTLRSGEASREERKAIIDSAQNKRYSRAVRMGRKNNRRS